MDVAELQRRIMAAREFEVTSGRVTWQVRVPSAVVMRALVARIDPSVEESARIAELQPHVMRHCIIGWRGISVRDLAPDADDMPLPFAPALIDDVADRWPALYDDAYLQIMRRYTDRQRALEDEAGKSRPGSTPG